MLSISIGEKKGRKGNKPVGKKANITIYHTR